MGPIQVYSLHIFRMPSQSLSSVRIFTHIHHAISAVYYIRDAFFAKVLYGEILDRVLLVSTILEARITCMGSDREVRDIPNVCSIHHQQLNDVDDMYG